jgi:hypothetical protein
VNAICLFVAGALRATLPATELTVGWDHSVEKTRWEERYRIDGTTLRLLEARIQGSGAGMEPPPQARLRNGWWTWHPAGQLFPQLRLTLSSYARDYDLCWRERCQTLRSLVASTASGVRPSTTREPRPHDATDIVEVRPCTGKSDE